LQNRRLLEIVLHWLSAGDLFSVHEIAVGAQIAMEGVKTYPVRINDRVPITIEANGCATVDGYQSADLT
jgi:hypothetical protein